MEVKGEIYRVAGPVVTAIGLDAKMYDLCKVGHEGLMGEVIQIVGDKTIIQVYEETGGIRPGEPCISTGMSLAVELGPVFMMGFRGHCISCLKRLAVSLAEGLLQMDLTTKNSGNSSLLSKKATM